MGLGAGISELSFQLQEWKTIRIITANTANEMGPNARIKLATISRRLNRASFSLLNVTKQVGSLFKCPRAARNAG